MKKSYFFKFFVFALVGALVILPSCKDYDDDISRLDRELGDAKTELTGSIASQLAALKNELNTSFDNKVKTVADDLAASKVKLAALEANSATKDQLDAVKAEILQQVVTLEVVEDLQADYDSEIAAILARIATLEEDGATKAELAALETEITGMLSELQDELDAIDVRVTALDTSLTAFMAKHDEDLQDVIASIATLKAELDPRISTIETLLDIAEGQSGVLNGIAADLADQLTKIGANADAIALLRSDLEAELADQLVLINANKAAIEAVEDDLAAKYAELVEADADLLAQIEANYEELDGKITLNKDAIDALTLRVVAIEDELPVIKQSIIDLGVTLSMKIEGVYKSLDHRVYSLTFIPDFTSQDGTPQIVVRGLTEWKFYKPANATNSEIWTVPGWESNWDENWAVLKRGVIYKGVTTLRYNVSPSNVQLTDFEVKQLVNKTSLVRAAGKVSAPIVLAGQATLANGVLSVPVVIEANNYNSADFGTVNAPLNNVSVALQVENINVAMDNNEERIVTSTEYIKANFDLSHARIALNEKSLKTDGTLLPVGIEYNDIAHASYASDISLWNGKSQSGNTTDVLNHTINLNDYIYGMFDDNYSNWEKMNEFGFNAHTFKFRRVYLQSEGVNQSNDYVNLTEDGVIGVVPANGQVNAAAVGRTPIVEVTALVNGKVHAVGYIKIHVTDAFDKSDVKFEFTLEDYELGCNSEYELTNVDIDAIDFDQIFNHPRIQLGKDAFFAEYNQNPMVVTKVSPTPSAATVGNLGDGTHVEFGYSINPATQSVNLFNYIEAYITNDAPAGTYKVTTRLTSNGYRPDVVITWNFKVTLPTNLALTANPAFLSNGIYKLEPTVYGQTPAPKTSTPYEGLLQNAFLHSNNNFNLGAVAGDQTCANYLTPYFVFTKVPTGFHIVQDPQSPQTETGTFEVRKNVTNELAAKIYYFQTGDANPLNFFSDKGFYILLNEETPTTPGEGAYPAYSQAAKDLVAAGWVEVQPRGYINNQPLNWVNLYDPFTIQITYPVKFNFADKYNLWDQGTGAKQQVEIVTIPTGSQILGTFQPNIVIKDFLNNDIRFGATIQGRTTGLIDHYEIDYTTYGTSWAPNVVFDVDNVTTSLPGGQLPFGMTLKVDPSSTHGHHIYKWENATGGSVQNAFEIYIPASIKHKWGTLEGKITIVVNPGTGEN